MKTFIYKGRSYFFRCSSYVNSNKIYIEMIDAIYCEFYSSITVNIDLFDSNLDVYNDVYHIVCLDTNNFPDAFRLMYSLGLADFIETIRSGSVWYPVVLLNVKRLQEYSINTCYNKKLYN